MASFLTRNNSRFLFSHDFVWCPIRDLEALLQGEKVSAHIKKSSRGCFFQNTALHYLCRPRDQLENCSFKEFLTVWETKNVTKSNEEDLLKFENTSHFKHPSFRKSRGRQGDRFLQGIQKRQRPLLAKVFQHDFPDAAKFNGSILQDSTPITEESETFSKLVLLLFLPLRCLDDMLLNNSYTRRLRRAMNHEKFKGEASEFLQNMQDTCSNCFRADSKEDDLQRRTQPMKDVCDDLNLFGDEEEDIEDEDDNQPQGVDLDQFIDMFEDKKDVQNNPIEPGGLPKTIDFDVVKSKGAHRCGYERVMDLHTTKPPNNSFVFPATTRTNGNSTDTPNHQSTTTNNSRPPTMKEVATVMLRKRVRRTKSFEDITGDENEVEVMPADGTAESIIDYADKANLDKEQKRAFEVMAASYCLTFHEADVSEISGFNRGTIGAIKRAQRKLKILANQMTGNGREKNNQLIMCLHGPGGSGKTTVIDLLLCYARDHAELLPEFVFNELTIVITAMTGVAATLLLGETTSRALSLNKKTPFDAETIEKWEQARLVIVDEISFADEDDVAKIHGNLAKLKQNINCPFGGVHIVFSGDFRQLEPVGTNKQKKKLALCYTDSTHFRHCINCFIELQGSWRFKDDPEWGKLLFRLRDGKATREDINKINERLADENTPDDLRHATYFNRDRDAINAALFERRCEHLMKTQGNCNSCLMIFSDDVQVRRSDKKYHPLQNCSKFWENCAEDDIKTPKMSGRMDPALRLYSGIPVMLPSNQNVKAGQANGTQAEVINIVLKPGITPKTAMINNNIPVPAVKANEVDHIVLKHSNKRINPPTFSVHSKSYSFAAKLPKPQSLSIGKNEKETIRMKATQFPVLVNNATTGHKLQGSGVNNLFVNSWSCVTNWPYVMLSRVKTRMGLFMRKKLSTNLEKYKVPQALTAMLRDLRTNAPSYWTKEQYIRQFFDFQTA